LFEIRTDLVVPTYLHFCLFQPAMPGARRRLEIFSSFPARELFGVSHRDRTGFLLKI
jgi:hypothetical protein